MATFRIGQRVKVRRVNHPQYQHLVGLCSTVSEIRPGEPETVYGLTDSPLELLMLHGVLRIAGFSADQLEPILPEGHQPAEEDFTKSLNALLTRVSQDVKEKA